MSLVINSKTRLSLLLLNLLTIILNSKSIKNLSNYQKRIECEYFSNRVEKNQSKIKSRFIL